MRDQWYSDKRDLVKWSVLIHLAKEQQVDRIIQIAFYNHSDFGNVQIDGQSYAVPDEVISHFRSITNVAALATPTKISVYDTQFSHQTRAIYLASAIKHVKSFGSERCIVFLDPDTGLEPNGKADRTHVIGSEAKAFWDALEKDWTLVFYQHQPNRNGEPWIEPKRTQFANALNISLNEVKLAVSNISKDVAFYFATKP